MFVHCSPTIVHCYLILLLGLIAVVGDYAVEYSKLHLYRALFDNTTHAAIGGFSWLIVCIIIKVRHHTQIVFEIVFATLLASCIDIDHFIAARSLYLKDAISLKRRPAFHCSTFPFLFTLLLLSFSYATQQKWPLRISLIIFTAFASHHTRDATRRGYWFYPFGSTPPISYTCYIALTIAIPYIVCTILYFVHLDRNADTFISV